MIRFGNEGCLLKSISQRIKCLHDYRPARLNEYSGDPSSERLKYALVSARDLVHGEGEILLPAGWEIIRSGGG